MSHPARSASLTLHSSGMLEEAVVLLHVSDDAGLVIFDEYTAPTHIGLSAGNHRILAAGLARSGIKAYCPTREETARYEAS